MGTRQHGRWHGRQAACGTRPRSGRVVSAGPSARRVGPIARRVGPIARRVGPIARRIGPQVEQLGPEVARRPPGVNEPVNQGRGGGVALTWLITYNYYFSIYYFKFFFNKKH